MTSVFFFHFVNLNLFTYLFNWLAASANINLLQDKLKLRLKTLEEGLKHVPSFSVNSNASFGSPKPEKSNNILGFLTSSGGLRKRSTSQPRASTISRSSPLQQPNIETEKANAAGELKRADSFKRKCSSREGMLRKGIWASRSKVIDSSGKENTELKANTDANIDKHKNDDRIISTEMKKKAGGNEDLQNKGSTDEDLQNKGSTKDDGEDVVSGFLYDRLQKEVINLRKSCEAKDSSLNTKDQEIQVK